MFYIFSVGTTLSNGGIFDSEESLKKVWAVPLGGPKFKMEEIRAHLIADQTV